MKTWEADLVEEIKQGSMEAFERCYRIYSTDIYTCIIHVCKNEADASELLQDTFLDVLQGIGHFKNNYSFKAWIKRIALNNTYNVIKKSNRLLLGDSLPELTSDEVIETLDILFEQEQLLDKVLKKISPIERIIMWMFIVEQYTHDEIAVILDKSPSYSKSILSRCLKHLEISNKANNYAYR